jgi:dienelactone hydrolase
MKLLLKSLSIVSLALSFNSFSAEITLTGQDSFELKADYFQGETKGTRAVLMLHQCNYNRSMYDTMGQQLSEQGIHALSLDFRGFGESINVEFNVENLSALPQEERRKQWQVMSTHWPSDVKIAYDYLQSKITKNGTIGVIGASCGGSQAITLAEKEPVAAISFFSSAQRDENIARYKAILADKPTLIIAAEDDGRTFTSAQTLFTTAKHSQSKMISYKGKSHGYPLLEVDKQLDKTVVNWFNNQL